jgi:hypothetical protein
VAFAGDNTAIWRGRSSTEGEITMLYDTAAIDGVFGLDTKGKREHKDENTPTLTGP